MALSGICMALFHKERTGKGQYIDVSMMDGGVVGENIGAAVIGLDEAEALFGVEPFHGACCHF